MTSIGERIKERRKVCNLSVVEIAAALGKARSTVYRYESDEVQGIPITVLEPLAEVLKTTPEYLMGWTDDPINYDDGDLIASIPLSYMELCDGDVQKAYALQQAAWKDRDNILPNKPSPTNLIPIRRMRIPMLGGIAAGEPILAEQQYDTYVEADVDVDCSYALRVDGDSMEPTVRFGDIVFIRQQEDVDDGQIAAVLIDDSATLKRIYHIPNGLQLLSDNAAKYPPRTVTFEDYDCIRILGLAVAFKRNL